MIELKGITRKFGDKTVLSDFSFTFEDRGIYAIDGESGSGKTTLLRVIAGLDRQYEGKVTMRNVSKIAYVFQEDRLIPSLTALKNVELVLKKEQRGEAMRLLRLFGLESDARLYPRQLSGGMKRRVAIARALAYGGDVLLLDEPFTGIDDLRKMKILRIIQDYSIDHTVILVTHDKSELASLNNPVRVSIH